MWYSLFFVLFTYIPISTTSDYKSFSHQHFSFTLISFNSTIPNKIMAAMSEEMGLGFFVLIGVGAFLLVAATAAGIVFLVLWRRRKRSSQAAATVGEEQPNYTLLSAAPMKSAGSMPSCLLSDETKSKKSAVPALKTTWLRGSKTKGTAPSAISTTKRPRACTYGVSVPLTVWMSGSNTKGASPSAISTTKKPKAGIITGHVPKAVSMAGKEVK